MVDPSRLRPEELDLLEDALEDLELEGVPETMMEGHPQLAATLEEYRELLLSSRDALSYEAAPRHVLDHVLGVAAGDIADVDAPAEIEPAVAPTKPRSWWKRWNAAVWVPGLALAGSAALVLVIVRPTTEDATVARSEPSMSAVDRAPADAEPQAVADEAAPTPVDGSPEPTDADAFGTFEQRQAPAAEATRQDPAFAPLPEPPAEVPPVQGTIKYDEKARSRGTAKPESGATKGGAPPTAKQKPAAPPMPNKPSMPSKKSDNDAPAGGNQQLQRADELREAGRCSDAEPIYRAVDETAVDNDERAQAINGLGLCARAGGRGDEAEKLLRQAEELAQ